MQKNTLLTLLLIATLGVLIFNQWQIGTISSRLGSVAVGTSSATPTGAATGTNGTASAVDVVPRGTPAIYGAELGIKYDDVSATNPTLADATIRKLATYDQQLTLSGESLQRYINIAGNISCEYCCGAPSIIFTKDQGQYKAGDAACGCAHSYAMRGLAKYLITKHGSEFTDAQILEELGKWKTLFFPDVMAQKATVLQSKGIELNYINLASNKYRGIEQGTSGGMVGGC